jgi:ubiquinone/menaquinone biosynthesis C-methylase UbiE
MPTDYDAIADWYDQVLRQGSLLHDQILAALPALLGPIAGQHVCDLACGQGIISRVLAERGAAVTGIDLSERLLTLALAEEARHPLGIHYQVGDAQHLPAIADASFDGLVCCMALMDIPDLPATARTIARVVRPGGWAVVVITHPCFQTPAAWWATDPEGHAYRAVRAYFDEGFWRSANPAGVRGQVGAHHRTLGALVNTFSLVGLLVDRLVEPHDQGPPALRVTGEAIVPALLLLRFRRSVGQESAMQG